MVYLLLLTHNITFNSLSSDNPPIFPQEKKYIAFMVVKFKNLIMVFLLGCITWWIPLSHSLKPLNRALSLYQGLFRTKIWRGGGRCVRVCVSQGLERGADRK